MTIAAITGSRADYGLLYTLLKALQLHAGFNLKIIVTGMHLSPDFGNTYNIIKQDGFIIDCTVDTLLASDSATSICKSIGLGIIGFADALNRVTPDLLVVLGDRYEIFAAVQAALIHQIPVAHIAGGDTTEGAYDEAFRHSITKMSHLHFATNTVAAQRIIQLGENPDHVFAVGSPGLDLIKNTSLLNKAQLEKKLGFQFKNKNIVITFHPMTLDNVDIHQQCRVLFNALNTLGPDVGLIFTKANADNQGRTINRLIDHYAADKPNAAAFTSLGQLNYYSLVAICDAVVGNSSSGLYEAPTLKTPTVNIGDRQKGRLCADSVINCEVSEHDIFDAITTAFSTEHNNVTNPYGDGSATQKILRVLEQFKAPEKRHTLTKKHFFNLYS
ncbi:MAG: UDP-N-acetylglucosamine 2-epimerase (hydrolyzing) [Gammaproteobacteria bacterium]|nr:UDP-N-acetylglucosamine 2-epimerase (hydrolyzing) [Gammaproteobacteria bacterium]